MEQKSDDNVSSSIQKIEKLTYGFIEEDPKETYFKPRMDRLMSSLCSNPAITYDINKTGYPDESVIKIIKDQLHPKSIDCFSKITCEWRSIEGRVGYVFNYILKSSDECIIVAIICGGM